MIDTSTNRHRGDTLQSGAPRYGRVALLAAGDLIVFLAFVLLGRANHRESASLAGVVATVAPFVVAWFVVSPWLGAFGHRGSPATTRPRRLLARTALAWIVACPAALILRAALWHDGIPLAFDLVAFVFNGALLLAWRGALTLLSS